MLNIDHHIIKGTRKDAENDAVEFKVGVIIHKTSSAYDAFGPRMTADGQIGKISRISQIVKKMMSTIDPLIYTRYETLAPRNLITKRRNENAREGFKYE